MIKRLQSQSSKTQSRPRFYSVEKQSAPRVFNKNKVNVYGVFEIQMPS